MKRRVLLRVHLCFGGSCCVSALSSISASVVLTNITVAFCLCSGTVLIEKGFFMQALYCTKDVLPYKRNACARDCAFQLCHTVKIGKDSV